MHTNVVIFYSNESTMEKDVFSRLKILARESTKKEEKVSENPLHDLIFGIYASYLSTTVVKKTVTPPKKATGKKIVPAGEFHTLKPYIITLTSYIAAPLNRTEFFKSILPTMTGRDGEILCVGNGEKIYDDEGNQKGYVMKIAKGYKGKIPGCLANHITLLLRLGERKDVQIRLSSTKIEAINCKSETDLDDAWYWLEVHFEYAISKGYDLFPSNEIPCLIESYAAMRNYNFYLPFQVNEDEVVRRITSHNEYGFTVFYTPSIQPGVKISCPADVNKIVPEQYREGGIYYNPEKKRKKTNEEPEHYLKIFYSGRCLLSSKGRLKETKRVYELMIALLFELRDVIEIK